MLSPQQSKRVDLLNSGKHEKRVLAAPFQNTSQKQVHQTISPKNSNAHATVSNEQVDYRTHTFKPLDHPQMVKMHTYCGPTTESNWVIPGVLLVGAYPASEDDRETLDLITSILRLGIKKFVCLQLEYRHDVTPEMWRYGKSLRPYFEDVKAIVANKHKYPQLSNAPMPVVEPHHLSFAHCPIVDCGITDDDRVLELCRQLVADISRGEVLYLHCWGGHGRTGTVVCIMLHLMYGLSAADAMARCQLVHDLRVCPVNVGSPQTQTQRDQVARIIGCLEDSHRLEKMKLSLQMHISAASISNNTNKPNGTSTGFSGEEDSSKTVVLAGGTASASSSSKIRTGGLAGHVHNNRLNSHNGNNSGNSSSINNNNNNNSNSINEFQIHASAAAEEPKPAAMKGPLASQISGKSGSSGSSGASSSSISNPVVQSVISERTTQQAPQPMGGPPQRNAIHQHPPPQHQPSLHQQLVARKLSASNGSTTPTMRYSFVSDSNVVSVAAAVASSNTTALSDSRSPSFVARTSLRHLDQCLLGSAFDMSGNNSGAPSPSPPHPLLRSVSSDYGFNLYETTAALDIRRDSHTADAVLVHQDAGSAMVVESLTSTSTPLAVKNPVFFFAPPVEEQQPQQQSSGSAEEMETTSSLPGEEQEEASRLSVVMTTEEDGATTDTTEETAVVGEGSESQSRPMSVSLEGTVGSETDNDSTPVDKPVAANDTVRQSSVEADSGTGVGGKVGGIAERQWSTSSKDSGKSDALVRQASGTGFNSSTVRTNYATTPKNSSGNNSAGNGNNASTISQVLSVARQVLLGNSANNANSPSNAATSTSATNSLGSSANTSGKTTPVRMTPIPPSGHAPTAASTSQQLSTGRRIDRAGSGKR